MITVPKVDLKRFKGLAKTMGWAFEPKKDNMEQDYTDFPCSFTEEEWEEELQLSMKEGEATDDQVKEFYRRWNIAL